MIHYLKIEKQYINDIFSGRKKAEVRYNDRNYSVGDLIVFTDLNQSIYNNSYKVIITHILDNFQLGLRDNYVVLSLSVVNKIGFNNLSGN
jgi:ASC-1-like (ASCH) protein